jgi:hypothetical protein
MDEREWAEFYQRYCAECVSAGVEPFAPAVAAELLADLCVLEPEQ